MPSWLAFFIVVTAAAVVLQMGILLALYLQLGGVTGPLGFAASDANAAGRQLFENHGAIAGSPPVPRRRHRNACSKSGRRALASPRAGGARAP